MLGKFLFTAAIALPLIGAHSFSRAEGLDVVGGSVSGEWWKGDHSAGASSWPEGFTLVEVDGEKFETSYISYDWKGTEEQ